MIRLAVTLLFSFFVIGTAQAQMMTRFEMEGPCTLRVTVPIEIYGSGATDDFAFEIRKNVRDQWSGPSADDAAVIGSTMGLDTDWISKNADWYEKYLKEEYDAVDPKVNVDGTQELVDNAGQIRGIYDDYMRQFSADPACIQGPCCQVKVVTDVKTRKAEDDPTPGYYQIEIVDDPDFRSYVWAGDKAREGVENPDPDNPDDWQLEPSQRGGSNGKWSNNAVDNAAAHEVGHLMGLMDRYTDVKDSSGKTIDSFQHHGHRHDIMAQSAAFPFADALSQLFEIGGMECDERLCCPGPIEDGFWQDYSETVLVGGDAIIVCDKPALRNLLQSLKDQRRNLELATGIPPQRKIPLAVSIDAEIKKVEAALAKECPRPVTGSEPRDDVAIGETYEPIPVEVDTDSEEWCEFGTDTPGGGTLIPGGGTPGTTVGPPGTTPGTPGTTPGTPGTTPGNPGTTPGNPGTTPGTTPGTPGTTPGGDPGTTPGLPGSVPGLPGGGENDEDDGDDPSDTGEPDDGDDPEETDDGDDPGDIPTTVIVKAKASVLNGGNTAPNAEIGGQRIKLIPDATSDPELPTSTGATKDAETGAGEDPAQCTTGGDGECEIKIDKGLLMFGLKDSGLGLSASYSLDVETPQYSGANVLSDEPLSDADKGAIASDLSDAGIGSGDIEYTEYELGDKWVTGVTWGAKLDWGVDYDFSLKAKYVIEEDLCRTIQPGPPVGAGISRLPAGSGELPSSRISLPGTNQEMPQ